MWSLGIIIYQIYDGVDTETRKIKLPVIEFKKKTEEEFYQLIEEEGISLKKKMCLNLFEV